MYLLVYEPREDCIHNYGIQTIIAIFMVVNIACNVRESLMVKERLPVNCLCSTA